MNQPLIHILVLLAISVFASGPLAAMGFTVPKSVDNPDGWGPPADCVPEEYAEVPYSPFSKSDKLGRAADWTQTGFGKFGGSAWRARRARCSCAAPASASRGFRVLARC